MVNITVPKGAQKKRKSWTFTKYFPKVSKIDPNKTPEYAKGKRKIFKRKKVRK